MPAATLADVNQFCAFLEQQWNICTISGKTYGQPYVWGGQHTHLTPGNYQSVINAKEADTGGYSDGTSFATAAKRYVKRIFDNTAITDLYAYDCSGLGCWFWYNQKGILTADLSADSMMRNTTLYKNTPAKGWWCFKINSAKQAYHIGYMVDNVHTVEAQGRTTGVIRQVFNDSYWDVWGVPKILEGVIPSPVSPKPGTQQDSPTGCQTTSGLPEETTSTLLIKVRGNRKRSVNVRRGPSTDFPIIMVAHGGDSFPLIRVSPSTGWYNIQLSDGGTGYITNKTKYTDMVKEV